MNLLKLLSFLIFFGIMPSTRAQTVEDGELFYLIGFNELTSGRLEAAADYFYQASLQKGTPEIVNKSLFYLSVTQSKLGNKPGAAYNASLIKESNLTAQERKFLEKLKDDLGTFYTQVKDYQELYQKQQNQITFWAMPYVGQANYSAKSQKDTATIYGIYAMATKRDWAFSLAVEKFNLKFKQNISDYEQTQLGTSFTKGIGAGALSLRYTQVQSETTNQSGIKVFGIGGQYWILPQLKLTSDLYHSTHPNSSLGDLSVNQLSASLDYIPYSSIEFDVGFKIGEQLLKASAQQIDDETTFIKGDLYSRFYTELYARYLKLYLSYSLWTGKEAFGVRNDGNIIFSGVEEHQGGQSANAIYSLTPGCRLQLSYMNEKIFITDTKSESNTVVGMINFSIN